MTLYMKIAFLSLTKNIGGGELSLLSILSSCNCDFTVYPSEKGQFTEILDQKGYKYRLFSVGRYISTLSSNSGKVKTIFSLLIYSIVFLFHIRREGSDVIYLNNYKAFYIGYIISFFIKSRFICHIRDGFSRGRAEKILLKRFDKINAIFFVNSKFTLDTVNATYSPRDIEVIYNGIEISEDDDVNHTSFHSKKSEYHIGIFSRISRVKGQLEFLESISSIADYKIIVHLYGDMVHGEESYFDLVKIKCQELISSGIKVIMHGYTNEPIEMMKKMDVVVLPTVNPEPFGRVIIEAQMLRKIVIANDLGGPKEIISNGINGFLVQGSEKNSYAKIINYVFSNWHNMDVIANNARNSVIDNYSKKTMVDKVNSRLRSHEDHTHK